MIFISHANEPKDNIFTRWIALQLAGLGYPVWCDQTMLLGGEKAWNDIESAIRDHSEKILVVLSRDSNIRENVLMELAVAARVGRDKKDFIIPLRIDDLQDHEITIELSRHTLIDFSKGWATALAKLIKKLDRDAVQKNETRFNYSSVAEWWRNNENQLADVSTTTEKCASNWFRIADLPEYIYIYSLVDPLKKDGPKQLDLGVPNYQEGGGLISFETPKEMAERLKDAGFAVAENLQIKLGDFQYHGHRGLKLGKREARNIITALLNQSFDLRCRGAGLRCYEMSNAKSCFWFPPGLIEGDKIAFQPISTKTRRGKPNRLMVGRVTGKKGVPRKRRWHFGISATLIRWPELAFAIRSHVIFTDANGELFPVKKQHTARRSECKSWYNDVWLDRMLAAMAFLHDPDSATFISVPCGTEVGFTISTHPICFLSPVSFGTITSVPETEKEDDDDDVTSDKDEDEVLEEEDDDEEEDEE